MANGIIHTMFKTPEQLQRLVMLH